jgi:response regulator RpfG family c-di-GMP phosphodiesterase
MTTQLQTRPTAVGEHDARAKILFVDDDTAVLDGLRRQFGSVFQVSTAGVATQALILVADRGPFAAVVSDMRMPGLDGIGFLRHMQAVAPDTVRLVLTGYADVEAAMAAVNHGHIFRFLVKPSDRETVRTALDAAVEQHRLITAERELLERTLQGSIRALLETLALANPMAFARAIRVKALVGNVLDVMDEPDRWEIEVACMLSQLGAVTLPPPIAEKMHRGMPLDEEEAAMVARMPDVAEHLLGEIPRLEGVRRIILAQDHHLRLGDAVPVGARVLRVALDFDTLEASHMEPSEIISTLAARTGRYDAEVLAAFARVREGGVPGGVREIGTTELRVGMVLASDVRAEDGTLLVGRGQHVTPGLLERLRNFSTRSALEPRVHVVDRDQ